MLAKIQDSCSVRAAVAIALGTAAFIAFAPQSAMAQAAQTTVPQPAAQAASTGDMLQEVTVTGSRIKRKDYSSNSPLVTIDSDQLEARSALNIESYLNQLPNFNPAATPTTEALDVQPTALTTVGISTISLRGLGANRSLVLIDGHRATPVNALMVTDINTIPSALIDRVEVVSGGESAVYGADAMGGVTNFILKKNFQGLQVDVQDGMSQVGDDNELRVSALMGTRFSDGKGSIMMGAEYYDRRAAWNNLRGFYQNGWADPNAATGYRNYGYNGYTSNQAPPSTAAVSTTFPGRNPAHLLAYNNSTISTYLFNNDSSIFTPTGLPTANFAQYGSMAPGVLAPNGYAFQNVFDPTQLNSATSATAPGVTQALKWANQQTLLSLPQTRYSFYANGNFEITPDLKFFTNVRFAQSRTQTATYALISSVTGWDVSIPYNQATDDPITPGLISPTTSAAQLQQISAAFANGTAAAAGYANPGYLAPGAAGVQHPVPWQLALLLDSRNLSGASRGVIYGGAATCNTGYSVTNAATRAPIAPCGTAAPTSWQLNYLPGLNQVPARSTLDTDTSWQIETGLDFPLHVSDWSGELYYSRGQSAAYQDAYGNDSLERLRAVVDAPGYGAGLAFQGNAASTSPNFGTSVVSTCSSGFYNVIFNNAAASADCQTSIGSILQTMTQVQQDIVEANFTGSLFKLPAGTVSAAVGYQYRRDAAQFIPDNLQSTSSFLDQTVGVYPTGSLDAHTTARDGYAELLVPLLSDIPFLKKLELNVGGRYSSYDVSPNATTFKVNLDATVTDSVRLRGGFNRATRTPNLGELYLNMQEYLGSSSVYGDPCSLRSLSPFGAGNAPGVANQSTADSTLPAVNSGKPSNAGGAAGAYSAYLICQQMMGNDGAGVYYGPNSSQASLAAPGLIGAFQNQQGNPDLRAETADTWTGGIVLSHLFENPWLSGLSATADYYRIDIRNAIELEGSDYANFLCYGATQVTDAAAAAAQANTAACQNVARNLGTGGVAISGLEFNNLATISTAGVDFTVNWIARLSDLGLQHVPGSIAFSTQTSWLDFYRTKASPLNFDVNTDWKGSLGPTLSGTNGGAYSYRAYTTFSYMLPSLTLSLHWQYLPSINPASYATQQAIIAHNQQMLVAGQPQNILNYTPSTAYAYPHYNNLGLSFNWAINTTLTMRGGIDNVFDAWPVYAGSRGYTTQDQIQNACSAAAKTYGCLTPSSYSMPLTGAGSTNSGFYDTIGRRFYLGFKATF